MPPTRELPPALWCIYHPDGGLTYVKHHAGIVILGFGSWQVAAKMLEPWKMPALSEPVPISQLGTTAFPYCPKMPETNLVMVIRTMGDLRDYARDPGAFALRSAPLICEIKCGPSEPETHGDNRATKSAGSLLRRILAMASTRLKACDPGRKN